MSNFELILGTYWSTIALVFIYRKYIYKEPVTVNKIICSTTFEEGVTVVDRIIDEHLKAYDLNATNDYLLAVNGDRTPKETIERIYANINESLAEEFISDFNRYVSPSYMSYHIRNRVEEHVLKMYSEKVEDKKKISSLSTENTTNAQAKLDLMNTVITVLSSLYTNDIVEGSRTLIEEYVADSELLFIDKSDSRYASLLEELIEQLASEMDNYVNKTKDIVEKEYEVIGVGANG